LKESVYDDRIRRHLAYCDQKLLNK